MTTIITIHDSVLGELTITLPDGYRHVSDAEYLRRRRRCERRDANARTDKQEREAWAPLAGVRIWDEPTATLLPISCSPYRGRVYVEPEREAGT